MYTGDLALLNARMLTMEPDRPQAEAALVTRGRIALVGTTREVRNAACGAAEFDCGGRVVVPGFIDGHAHMEMTCLAFQQRIFCHTPPLESLSDIVVVLRSEVAKSPPGRWILGRGSFGMAGRVEEGRLFSRHDLDAISTQHPIVLYSGFHVGMLNTMALKELDLWDDPANPPRGVFVHLEASGKPTGVVTEVWSLVPPFSAEETIEALRAQVTDLFVSRGVTTSHTIPFAPHDVRSIRELQARGEFPMRVSVFYHVPQMLSLDSLLATGLETGFGDDMLRYGGVKIFVNGIGSDGMGHTMPDFKWTQEELNEFVARTHAGGLQLMMHTIGADGARMGAAAIEEVARHHPSGHRLRLEHGADAPLTDEDIARFRKAGVRLVATPQFMYVGGVGGAAEIASVRLRTLIDQEFEVIGGTDSTGTVLESTAPLFNIACAVTRRNRDGVVSHPEEGITAEEGLKMFTIWAARGAYEEADKGSIAVGKLGDFAVLSGDPREVDGDELFAMGVEATILGGEVVFGN